MASYRTQNYVAGRLDLPVIDLFNLAARRAVVVEPLAHGAHEAVAQQLGLGVGGALAELREADGCGEVLAQAVPPQMPLLQELLHMFRRRATRTSLEENPTGQQRDDGEHLRGSSELEDGEQVSEVVPEHVTGAGDGVEPLPGAGAGYGAGLGWGDELNVQSGGVVCSHVLVHQPDQVSIVSAGGVKPEDRLSAGGLGSAHGQLHPILDRKVLGLAHSPNIALVDSVGED